MTELHRKSKDFTKEERERLLLQYQGSGLTYQEFAREHNINEDTFKNWKWIAERPPGLRVRRTPVERKKIVEAFLSAQSTGMSVDEFAKVWGVSGPTLSEWLKRYEEFGAEGLMNGAPKKPGDKRYGSKVPEAVKDEIIRIKKQDPSFGIKKIKNWMFRFSGLKVSAGSIRKTVKKEGLALAIKPRKKKKSSDRVRRFERAKPMQMWQSDITQFTLGPSSMRVYLTVFMDDHSRYVVAWRLMSRQTADLVMDAFKDGVVRFGKPSEVLTDQGRQYFAWRGKSELERLLEKEGIKHVVSRAHHPQTLGKCERFWETVVNEFWTRAKPQDLEEARVRLKYFIDHYNHHRPHQGLDGQVPADRFFGVAKDVREVIEKTVEQNALAMAIGEMPRPPAFLIGQVGDQRIAFHGTSGSFYLTHENILGEKADGKTDGKANGDESGNDNRKSEQTKFIESKQAAEDQEINIKSRVKFDSPTSAEARRGSEISDSTDAWSLGDGKAGGEEQSQGDGTSAHGILDGEVNKERGNGEVIDSSGEVLAALKSSGGGIDGGTTHSATI